VGYLASQPSVDGLAMRRAMVHGTATASFCGEAVGTAATVGLARGDVKTRVDAIRRLYDFGAASMS
jgi:hypothetical protein